VEVRLQVHHALEFIVAEQAFDVVPDCEGGGARFIDGVEDTFGDRRVEPIGDAMVVHHPIGVALVDRWRGEDMGLEAELAEDGVDESSPLVVVGLLDVEDDGHMGTNVHLLDQGCQGRWRGDDVGGVRGSRGARRRGHGSESRGGRRQICEFGSLGH
jgi:hypothetical protein